MKRLFLLASTIFCFTNLINAQAGRLDTSFGKNGIVTADLGKEYNFPTYAASTIITDSNGSIYLTELSQTYVSKRHSDGSRDVNYGNKGYSADAGFTFQKAAMQPDGKIVGVGVINAGSGIDFAVVRYNKNGNLDSSFSGDGKQTIDFSTAASGVSSDYANAVTVQPDGKIIVAGRSDIRKLSGGTQAFLRLARCNSDGSPDSTFDNDGKQESTIPYYFDRCILAVQQDGKIVVAGNFLSRLVRFNANGTLDSTFKAEISEGAEAFYSVNSMVIQKDGKIVIESSLGYDRLKNLLYRFNTDGSLDSSFSGDGKQPLRFGSDIALQAGGKIIVTSAGSLYRYKTDGSIDSTFGKNGKQSIADSVRSRLVVVQQDGKILVGGGSIGPDGSLTYFALARFSSDGKPDKTFDKNGVVTDNFHAGNTTFKNTVVQKDGKILAAGQTWNGNSFDFVIARYNTNGSPDSTFSNDGILITGITFKLNDYGNANTSIALQSDGKIVAAGDYTLARYNADGSADNTFSGDGKLVTDTTTYIGAIAIQSDNKMVAGQIYRAFFDIDPAVVRYNTDGSVDKTFGAGGKHLIKNPNPGGSNSLGIHFITFQKNGKIVVTGSSPGVVVARLNTDGSTDSTFNNEGAVELPIYGLGSAAIQNDGKIVVGAFETFRNNYNYAVRLNNDGKSDSSFSGTGINRVSIKNGLSIPSVDNGNFAVIQKNGKILVLGAAITRYNTNGHLDSTFGNNGIQATQASDNNIFRNSIAISDNKLYAVGYTNSQGIVGLIAGYLLNNDSSNTPPTVSLTAPANNAKYLAPASIKLSAAASDSGGTITKVEFYNGSKLLHTETVIPYGYVWRHVPAGNYTITAKAYDNSGIAATSAPVHISVVPNKAPAVSIISPADNSTFADTATIRLAASAADTDGRITRVEFYSGTTLLRTEYKYPYTYNWTNVTAGTYIITAKAIDNYGAQTTSAPITITVTSSSAIVSSRPYSESQKTALNDALSLRLSPNPANNVLNISASLLQQVKSATLSIISASGIVLKTIQISNAATQLDVSSLVSGVYTMKIVSGQKVMYKQFVKL